jgi:hypothetical protein
MNLKDIFGDFEYVYNFGPSSLGDGIIDVRDLQNWVSSRYLKREYSGFEQTLDDYLVFNRNRFFSGKIYSFLYTGEGPDVHPMFLSITNKIEKGDRLFEIGININYLHPKERVRLFKGILNAFPNQLSDNIEKIQDGTREQVDLPLIHKEYRDKFFDIIDMRPKLIKINRSKIARDSIKVVRYEDWKYLIYYLPTTFINTNPSEVYKERP